MCACGRRFHKKQKYLLVLNNCSLLHLYFASLITDNFANRYHSYIHEHLLWLQGYRVIFRTTRTLLNFIIYDIFFWGISTRNVKRYLNYLDRYLLLVYLEGRVL